jgi:hypothetical protein
MTAPLCEADVMAAGVRVASGWPAGLNSRWLGRVNMSPFVADDVAGYIRYLTEHAA